MGGGADGKDLLEGLLEAAEEAWLVSDASGRIVYANPPAEGLFGRQRAGLVGGFVESLLSERDRAAHVARRNESLAARQPRPLEGAYDAHVRRADGSEMPVHLRLTPLSTPRGALLAVSLRRVPTQGEDPSKADAIARPLARRIVQDLVETGGVAHQILQQVGRRLATETRATTLTEYAQHFAEMGLGNLAIDKDEGVRTSFTGTDLLEKRPGSRVSTCAFTLGYLSEAVSRTHGGESTLGAEIECQSRGAPQCRFIVHVKKQEEGLARRVKELI